eukprot:TRINITY_DN1118_c0_g1_i1.p2 TRINITY_DN1118_c0_g1~~TRINITY_DN1118_c0_g1_i1.p2  ORF type:complete len:168 (-),score=33.91 TRINITY_DN1118_c0_g1_i1:41-544(-)
MCIRDSINAEYMGQILMEKMSNFKFEILLDRRDLEQLQMLTTKELMEQLLFTIQQMKNRLQTLKNFGWAKQNNMEKKNVELMLLGNKNDLENEKKVDFEFAQTFSRERKVLFYETSAKAASAVNSSFIELSKILMAKHKPKIASEQKKPNTILTPTGDTKTQEKSCC